MSEVFSTRLRAVRSKELDSLLAGINKLAFKVEIKGNPVRQKGKWYLFFVIPDHIEDKKFPLIVDLDLD